MGIEFDNPWDYVPPRRRSIHTLGEKMGIMCIYITVRQIILAHEEHAEFRARVVAANTKKQARFEKLLAFNKIYDHAEGYWLNPYPDSGAETAQEEMKVPPGQDLKDTEWMDRQKEVNERDRGRRGLRLDPMENEMHQNDVKNEEGQATIELAERKKQAGETVQTEKRKRTRRIRSVEHDWVARHQEVQERQYEKKMALAEKRRVYDEDAAWERKEKRTQKEKEREAWWTLENFSY
jgi:flagellar biosynthesis GTPase FlhF